MKAIHLSRVEHSYKAGDEPPVMPPSFEGDAMFYEDGERIGFYLEKMPDTMQPFIDIADYELNSARVPKTVMVRANGLNDRELAVKQESAIIGTVPRNIRMRRWHHSRSSVHGYKTAQTFIKAMMIAGRQSLSVIKDITPELYETHRKAVTERVPEKWRFCDLFTSSISNANIAAAVHRDNRNVVGALNVIVTRRVNATGGNLYLPEYDVTLPSAHNSLTVYPAWRNYHGVTPIEPTHPGGYRNSLIWYALDAFKDEVDDAE